MRTTVNLDAEAERAVEDERRRSGAGLSEAVNALIRRGATPDRVDYVYPSIRFEMGARLPLDRTGELLDALDDGALA